MKGKHSAGAASAKVAASARGGNPPPGQRRTAATPNTSKSMTGGRPAVSSRIGKKS